MRSKVVVVLVALVALGAIGWLVLGREGVERLFSLGRDEATSEGDALGSGGRAKGDDGASERGRGDDAPRRGPALLGSKRIARVGKGGLRGRVLDVKTAKGVAKAALHVVGTGLAKETVDARAESAAEGHFELRDLAAGEEYELVVEAAGAASLRVRGLVVRADQTKDVGELWLGAPGTLEGIVLDPAGVGVKDADVQLHRGVGSLREFLQSGGLMDMFANMDREPEPLQRTTTSAKGAFRLESASPGPMSIVVRAPGFKQAVVSLTLTADAAHEPVKVRLVAGAKLSGRVVDAEGRGMGGVHLAAFSEDGGMPTPISRTFADSGSDGVFRFTSLPGDGQHMLVAATPGYPTAFTKAKAGDTDAKITMKRGATLEVRILGGEPAKPIPGAQVLIAVGDRSKMDDGPGSLIGALTDASGVAVMEVQPGELQMAMVNAPGFPATFWQAGSDDQGAAGMFGLKGPADPKVPEGRTSVEFSIPSGIRVWGKVMDVDGNGLGGAEVSSVDFFGGGAHATAAPDGSYELRVGSGMGFGMGGLQARLTGWVQVDTDTPDKAEDKPDSADDKPPTEVRLDVRMKRATSVGGRVLDPKGQPVSGAKVVVHPQKEKQGFDLSAMFGTEASSITLANGSYVVDGVPAEAKVRVTASREGFVEAQTEEFEVGKVGISKAPDVRLLSGASVTVQVLGPDGQGVPGARVKVEVARSDGMSRTDFDSIMDGQSGKADVRTGPGGAADVPLLPPGKATFHVTAEGFAPAGAHLTLVEEAAPAEPLVVRVKPGLTLAGRVVDGDGRPIEGASVHAKNVYAVSRSPGGGNAVPVPSPDDEWSNNDWESSRRTKTDAQGQWRLSDLPDRPLQLEASHDGYDQKTAAVGDDRTGIEVRLAKQDPDVAKRIAEIDKQLMALYQQISSAKGEAQQALVQEITKLQAEKTRLKGGD
jgi:protocatechuate 3,4-dioxygenase beta subunit